MNDQTQDVREPFENHYDQNNALKPGQTATHRWVSGRDGYDLPSINRAYEYFKAGFAVAQGEQQ